ncbi:RDD family protein [Lewinella sp. JB7]|uniref:RDD family protein n=1 Tax=Lewinella sp. JB7 TaxID=2962887 RepID=UPI0020C9CBA1|nr:RDD family protein [Lewinella sp. JB7]MCP9237319.1 RDD family protein [Lewinella sp. JB7]
MSVFRRYFLYLFDCLVMLGLLGVVFFVYRGEFPFHYATDRWLEVLLGGSGVYFTTLIGSTIYWYIVDYHPSIVRFRRSHILTRPDHRSPDVTTRFLRSFVKAFTLFGGEVLLLFAIFSSEHRFLHDYIAKTERVPLTQVARD